MASQNNLQSLIPKKKLKIKNQFKLAPQNNLQSSIINLINQKSKIQNQQSTIITSAARIEGKILWVNRLFFVGQKERP